MALGLSLAQAADPESNNNGTNQPIKLKIGTAGGPNDTVESPEAKAARLAAEEEKRARIEREKRDHQKGDPH